MDGTTVISIIIPSLVTIAGLIINYRQTKQNFKNQLDNQSQNFQNELSKQKIDFENELSKQKRGVLLEQMATVPYDLIKFYNRMIDSEKNKVSQPVLIKEMLDLYSRIFAYGTEDAIKIMASMQSENYIIAADIEKDNGLRPLVYFVLLACQIKYDITGIAICPIRWLQIKINDYDKRKPELIEANNQLVKELGLLEAFMLNVSN